MRHKVGLAIWLVGVALVAGPANAGEWDFTGLVAGEFRGFFQVSQFPGQLHGSQPSIIFSPELRYLSASGRHQFNVLAFARLDGRDSKRTHYDLRQAYWRYIGTGWEVLAGVNKVFWGVTESRHLVDIVNQMDFVEDIDGEDKLGQAMLNVSFQKSWGNIGVFVMPGFRERTFPSYGGRVRFPLPVDEEAVYESSAGKRHIDYALRYSHYFGDWDVGVSFFHGTNREPRLLPNESGTALVPHYGVIGQVGVDLQYTKKAWLFKLESIVREGHGTRFAAAVGGLEYTFYQAFDTAADLGILVEYLYDGRDSQAPATVFDDDIFFGARVALNDAQDTQALVGAVVDRNHGSTAVSIEAERRLGQRFKIELESRLFFNAATGDVLRSFARDDFAIVRLSWFF